MFIIATGAPGIKWQSYSIPESLSSPPLAVFSSDKASDQAQDDIRQDEEVRVRRSPVSTTTSSEHWVEVAMVADHTMLEYHGAHELEAYLFTLMNMVSRGNL